MKLLGRTLPPDLAAAVADHLKNRERELGRPLRPDDELFPDVDPVQFRADAIQAMKAAGTRPELIYAFAKTDRILSRDTYRRVPKKVRSEWDGALAEFHKLVKEGVDPLAHL